MKFNRAKILTVLIPITMAMFAMGQACSPKSPLTLADNSTTNGSIGTVGGGYNPPVIPPTGPSYSITSVSNYGISNGSMTLVLWGTFGGNGDVVTVSCSGSNPVNISAGGAGFYDSVSQINASIPAPTIPQSCTVSMANGSSSATAPSALQINPNQQQLILNPNGVVPNTEDATNDYLSIWAPYGFSSAWTLGVSSGSAPLTLFMSCNGQLVSSAAVIYADSELVNISFPKSTVANNTSCAFGFVTSLGVTSSSETYMVTY